MRFIFAMLLAIWPAIAAAQNLPAALIAKVERNSEKVLDELVVIITGYGQNGAIDLAGLKALVAIERAEARAKGFWRLQDADLDGDGAISGEELRQKAAASAATARGRPVLYFGKADANGDGRVAVAELQSYANGVALQAFSEKRAAQLYEVMAFDKNGDGRVTLAEAKAAIAVVLSRAAGKKAKGQKANAAKTKAPSAPLGRAI